MSKIKKADLLQLVQEQAEMMVELSGMVKMNKLSIIKLENEREQPKPKQLDQSIFDGLDEKWRFAAFNTPSNSPILFSVKPHKSMYGKWYAVLDCDEYMTLDELEGVYEYTDDWQNSLIERDTAKELTGSDLARAMLARGDRWILCGNTTDGFASPCIIDGYRCSEDDLGFVLTNGKSIEPRYIHPVNNQGEPLTQAEAGL